MIAATPDSPLPLRRLLRQKLLLQREEFAAGPAAAAATEALASHLVAVIAQMEPQCLGLYWPMRFEFNATAAIAADEELANLPLALPFSRRTPREMHFRAWDGKAPSLQDECGIASSNGAPIVPDIVLAPCVGYTAAGFRLGYGGGYFDRWMAAHPHVTVLGVAWSVSEVGAAEFVPEPHDQPLAAIITERGVVSA